MCACECREIINITRKLYAFVIYRHAMKMCLVRSYEHLGIVGIVLN